MRICVSGAGGVGGYFGVRLAAAGNSVAFIARGATLEALRRDGLRVESSLGDIFLPGVEATDDPADVGEVAAVILGVKAWQRDIMDGRPSELEALNGAVVRLGRDAGVPTPIHGFMYAALAPMEAQARRAVTTAR